MGHRPFPEELDLLGDILCECLSVIAQDADEVIAAVTPEMEEAADLETVSDVEFVT